MIRILLTPNDVLDADGLAHLRNSTNEKHGRKHRAGLVTDSRGGFLVNRTGTRGEKTFSIWAPHLHWYRFKEYGFHDDPDFDPDIEVRGVDELTEWGTPKKLLVKPDDPIGRRYVLADGVDHPVWYLVGWHHGSFCKDPRFWYTKMRKPAFLVPRKLLLPMETFFDCNGIATPESDRFWPSTTEG